MAHLGGRPVAIYTLDPLALACVSAWMVDGGISWVLKLTSVPSISKNKAYFCVMPISSSFTAFCQYVIFPSANIQQNDDNAKPFKKRVKKKCTTEFVVQLRE